MKFTNTLYLFFSITIALAIPLAAGAKETIAPTYADVSYGNDPRNVIDFWQAEGEGPRPLLVYIHGGGWAAGDKSKQGPKKETFLNKGISYAAFNYRLTKKHPLPAPIADSARAIQFLRSKSKEWNIDTSRICLYGSSAGGCISMWLLCHDDLAMPHAEDPLQRESTRVAAAVSQVGQTSIDPKQLAEWLGPEGATHHMLRMAVGEKSVESMFENYDQHKVLFSEFSPYNHVSKDDPPLYMSYGGDISLPSRSPGHGIHHGVQGIKMKEKADESGMECHLKIGKGEVYNSDKYKNSNDFIFSILLDEK